MLIDCAAESNHSFGNIPVFDKKDYHPYVFEVAED